VRSGASIGPECSCTASTSDILLLNRHYEYLVYRNLWPALLVEYWGTNSFCRTSHELSIPADNRAVYFAFAFVCHNRKECFAVWHNNGNFPLMTTEDCGEMSGVCVWYLVSIALFKIRMQERNHISICLALRKLLRDKAIAAENSGIYQLLATKAALSMMYSDPLLRNTVGHGSFQRAKIFFGPFSTSSWS